MGTLNYTGISYYDNLVQYTAFTYSCNLIYCVIISLTTNIKTPKAYNSSNNYTCLICVLSFQMYIILP